jgi:hypothetical protein
MNSVKVKSLNKPNLLSRLKEKAKSAAAITGQIVQIPAGVKAFVCPNHTGPGGKPVKVVISFLPREKERTCECGTIYKRVSA